ncbi:hypothetical protein KIL84_008763 [Mauremys mutica]|uniref:Uncharacterized protein n=1 Tax=Mauremys mutica TaxID=74926 RepID=A0A9D3X777_9SAUR|nr:hypothetical protein KIL84_008763 [Mauremys mutica]
MSVALGRWARGNRPVLWCIITGCCVVELLNFFGTGFPGVNVAPASILLPIQDHNSNRLHLLQAAVLESTIASLETCRRYRQDLNWAASTLEPAQSERMGLEERSRKLSWKRLAFPGEIPSCASRL